MLRELKKRETSNEADADDSREEGDSIEKARDGGNQGSKEDDSTEKAVEMTSVTIDTSDGDSKVTV